ncbi:MAG TPA: hypothetical protein VG324_02750, partial [Blastocatellia bacterium]|nr:hypothetical protein [Blastocatellia bacterium]
TERADQAHPQAQLVGQRILVDKTEKDSHSLSASYTVTCERRNSVAREMESLLMAKRDRIIMGNRLSL